MSLTHGALCAGYGGTGMAAENVLGELDTRWMCDFKAESLDLLAHRYPDAHLYGDLTRVDWAQAEPVDVITVSWPCQPHSSAGKRLGSEDPRAIWPHVLHVIDTLRPRYVLGENVARIATNGELRRVVESLAGLGYVGAWRCLNASDVGAPHRRSRCFLVAAAADSLGVELRNEPGRRGGARREGAGVAGHHGAAGTVRLLKTPTAQLATNGGTQHPDKRKAGGHGPTLADEVEWLLPTPAVADARNTRNATAGRSADQGHHHGGWTLCDRVFEGSLSSHRDWGVFEPAIRRWERASGRPAPEPTMPSVRRSDRESLSPRFVEWMMGLPEGWVTGVPGLTRNEQLSLLGDGVVPQQGAAAYRELLAALAQGVAA